jgi:hypothetical protein
MGGDIVMTVPFAGHPEMIIMVSFIIVAPGRRDIIDRDVIIL